MASYKGGGYTTLLAKSKDESLKIIKSLKVLSRFVEIRFNNLLYSKTRNMKHLFEFITFNQMGIAMLQY